jgi:hypothetical protein
MLKFINLVGVELEGGWNHAPERMIRDGSVNFPRSLNVQYPGEIPSPPYPFTDTLKKWIKENYPDHVNETCGFHIHVSFTRLFYYQVLMSKKFFDYFLKEAGVWGKKACPGYDNFWRRLNGRVHYCAPSYQPDAQAAARDKGDARYSALNYCFGLHKTIESRLMPMFNTPDEAWEAVKFTVNTMRRYLAQNVRIERKKAVEEEILADDQPTAKPELILL